MRIGVLKTRLPVAIAINLAVGVLYGWSIFLKGLETELSADRSTISAAPSIALTCFTIGALTHQRLLKIIGIRWFVFIACGLAAAGHLLFAATPSVVSLLVGYGVVYGLAAGLCYAIALYLAASSTEDQRRRGSAIGLATSSFAVTGLILSLLSEGLIDFAKPRQIFATIGAIQLLVGAVSFLVIGRNEPKQLGPHSKQDERQSRTYRRDVFFLGLVGAFFMVCFIGLMTISHASAIMIDRGSSTAFAGYAPLLVNTGYIVFAVLGGTFAVAVPDRVALSVVSACAFFGVIVVAVAPVPSICGAGLWIIGASLGASSSVYPAVIGRKYGVENIGPIYGRVLVAYGASGLIAPWLTGILFVWTGAYTVALWAAAVLGFLSILIVLKATARRRAALGLSL
jgi:MFS transporter, OFA family, oxalate/formate antiporter